MTVTPTILDGVLVSELDDHGDGTGTRTHYAPDGTVDRTEEIVGLPVLGALDAEIAAARASLLAATTVAQTKARTVVLFDLLTTDPGETP